MSRITTNAHFIGGPLHKKFLVLEGFPQWHRAIERKPSDTGIALLTNEEIKSALNYVEYGFSHIIAFGPHQSVAIYLLTSTLP